MYAVNKYVDIYFNIYCHLEKKQVTKKNVSHALKKNKLNMIEK